MTKFQKLLRQYRSSKNITRKQLAEELSLSEQSLKWWELGWSKPKEATKRYVELYVEKNSFFRFTYAEK